MCVLLPYISFGMETRLSTSFWAEALIRRASVGGAAAFVLQKGDAERGDVLVKLALLDRTARLYAPAMDMEGGRIFIDLAMQGIGPDETEIDQYIARACERDRDLWVIEIEDREGRHFLTELVQTE